MIRFLLLLPLRLALALVVRLVLALPLRLLLLVGVVSWAVCGCAAGPDPAEMRRAVLARSPEEDPSLAAVVTTVPMVRSDRDDDCGPAALTAALDAAGHPTTLDEVREAVFDREKGGTPGSALIRHARAQGLFALGRERWYFEDLMAWVQAGVAPVLDVSLASGSRHWVVLTGYDEDLRAVILQDQTGEWTLHYDLFFPAWCETNAWALVVVDPSGEIPDDAGLDARELGAAGWLAEQKGDLNGAARHYRSALRVDPGYAAARNNLDSVLRRLEPSDTP